jgi:hypothetical protein
VFEALTIQSRNGPYNVSFTPDLLQDVALINNRAAHYLVDSNVARLYARQLSTVISDPRALIIEATEKNKSLEK